MQTYYTKDQELKYWAGIDRNKAMKGPKDKRTACEKHVIVKI